MALQLKNFSISVPQNLSDIPHNQFDSIFNDGAIQDFSMYAILHMYRIELNSAEKDFELIPNFFKSFV